MTRQSVAWTLGVTACALVAAGAGASPALAQSTAAGAAVTAGPAVRPWEIEAYGGLSIGHIPSGGAVTLPPAGAPITTTGVTFQSRTTSSWFFGDGAALLNEVNQEFGLPQRVSPLDPALSLLALSGGPSAAFGVRVRRSVGHRLAVEVALDFLPGSGPPPAAFLTAAESTRASFVTAFQALFSSGPFAQTNVSAATTMSAGAFGEVSATGAIVLPFSARGGFRPYVTMGGGLLVPRGHAPSVSIQGSYATTVVLTGAPISERDTVTVRFDTHRVPIAVVGGGVSKSLSSRLGVRLDARLLLGPNPGQTSIDASPSVTISVPAAAIQTGGSPSIQFSNNPSTGRVSSLTGPALNNFRVLTGEGSQIRGIMTIGLYCRF